VIRSKAALLSALVGALLLVPAAAQAATLSVDNDGQQCPAAPYTSIQAAVDAASPGDTIAICPGVYVEGSGAPGTNAVTISKSLTIKGAGADMVAIEPRRSTPTGGQIAESNMNIRNGVGDVVSVIGGSSFPITVDISGLTVDGNGVFSEAGVVFLDAQGSLVRDRVTNIVTSISNTAYELPGGYRSNQFGYGVAQVTAAIEPPPGNAPRPLTIDHTRIDRYNKIGVLIDGATGNSLPLTPSGVVNSGSLEATQVIGRVQCLPFNTPTPPPYVLGGVNKTPENQLPGNCAGVGLTTTGPTFGQDGVRVTGGATVAIKDSLISQNLVNGTGAPPYSHYGEKTNDPPVIETANNSNLALAAALRLIGAGASTVSHSNLVDNAYGAYNADLTGTAPNTATPLTATENWWGMAVKATGNLGPAISPATNPFYQENPVNGTATPDGVGTTSDAVDFFPFRSGSQSDPNTGQWPVIYAPLPVGDAAPTVLLTTDKEDYDRGEVVHLTATASDDFGVNAISFYDGDELITTVIPPNHTATLAIPADAACASQALSAVASDFLGQTGSDSAEIAVVGPNNCEPEPEPEPEPGPPTVKLASPFPTLGAEGATFSATATADTAAGASVVKVVFSLGSKEVCTDTTAPYECKVVPTGADVGGQTLRAVVTDSVDQTAADEAPIEVEKFTPAGLSLKVEGKNTGKGKKKKLVRTLSGGLQLPAGVDAAEGCATGTVAITVQRNGNTIFPLTQVPLTESCTYKLKFTVAKKQGKTSFHATAKFGGNAVLRPVSTNRRFH
jgi:hypothetical protein